MEYTRTIPKKRTARQVAMEILNEASTILEMFTLGVDRPQIEEKLCQYIAPAIDRFMKKYFSPLLKNNEKKNNGEWQGRINDVVDIEESVWLPGLGLKGKYSTNKKYSTNYARCLNFGCRQNVDSHLNHLNNILIK